MQSTENRYHLNINRFDEPLRAGDFSVFQIGTMYCNGNTVVPTHVQGDLYEITFVRAGRGIVTTNNCKTAVRSGDIYLSFSGDFHAIESDAEHPLRYAFLAFQTEAEYYKAALETLVSLCGAPTSRKVSGDRIGMLLEDALAEISAGGEPNERLLEAVLSQIVIYLVRAFDSEHAGKNTLSVSDAEALCYRMINYIDTHIFSMGGLWELADELRYNYSYLSGLFKRVTGGTLAEYYSTRRLESARLMIEEGKLTLAQIAERLHYSSPGAFSRAFHKHYGIPPRDIKKHT